MAAKEVPADPPDRRCNFSDVEGPECSGDIAPLQSFDKVRVNSTTKEYQQILGRIGEFDNPQKRTDICSAHQAHLGWNFRDRRRMCGSTVRKEEPCSAKVGKEITYMQSRQFYYFTGSLIPPNQKICRRCLEEVKQQIEIGEKTQMEWDSRSASLQDSEGSQFQPSQNSGLQDARAGLNMAFVALGSDKKITYSLQQSLSSVTPRQQHYVKSQGADAVALAIETCAPNDKEGLWNALQSSKMIEAALGISRNDKVLSDIVRAYNSADGRCEKIQILSALTKTYSFQQLKDWESQTTGMMFIPTLTKHRFHTAHLHSLTVGPLKKFEPNAQFRQRINPLVLELLVEFLADTSVTNSTAYGTFTMTIEGEKQMVNKVVRSQGDALLVKQAQIYISENGFPSPCKRTLFHFLKLCVASKAKSLKGLDNIKEACRRAFLSLAQEIDLLGQKGMETEWHKEILSLLFTSQSYLKSQYSGNLEVSSSCPSHCLTWSLSDTNEAFREECDHQHDMECELCPLLVKLFRLVHGGMASCLLGEELEEHVHLLKQWSKSILDCQTHLVRIVCQEMDIKEYLHEKNQSRVNLTLDWSMKFLSELHRESKQEWYGKKGINLHQGVFQRPISNGAKWYVETDCYATVFHDAVKQDANTTAALLLANLKSYQKNNPEVSEADLDADNAGNYKCSRFVSLLLGINSLLSGLKIRFLKFSEAEAGKSICDRYGGVQKRFALKSVSNGFNINNGTELAGSITRNGGIANVTTILGKLSPLQEEDDEDEDGNEETQELTIPNIKLYSSFELLEGQVRVKRHGILGQGALIPLNPIKPPNSFDFEEVPIQPITLPMQLHQRVTEDGQPDARDIHQRRTLIPLVEDGLVEGEEDCASDDSDLEDGNEEDEELVFSCPDEKCTKRYLRHKSLMAHVTRGVHVHCLRSESSATALKKMYFSLYGIGKGQEPKSYREARTLRRNLVDITIPLLSEDWPEEGDYGTPFVQGWALKSKTVAKRFSACQKAFLVELFQQGEESGCKVSAKAAAQRMRVKKTENGSAMFKPEEWLTEMQIKSFFSRRHRETQGGEARD